MPRDPAIARGDGRYARILKTLARMDLLILDDWGLATLATAECRDLFEILEDRHGRKATIVTSQLPLDAWHEVIGASTIADAILERLVHNAHRLELTEDVPVHGFETGLWVRRRSACSRFALV